MSGGVGNVTDEEAVVRSYPDACKDYCIGFGGACFMCSVLFSLLLFSPLDASSSIRLATQVMYGGTAIFGGVAIGAAYIAPVRFYELLEDEHVTDKTADGEVGDSE